MDNKPKAKRGRGRPPGAKNKNKDKTVTTTELAKILGVSTGKLRTAIATGRVPATCYTKDGGRTGTYRFDEKSAVREYRENANHKSINKKYLAANPGLDPSAAAPTDKTKMGKGQATLTQIRQDTELLNYEKKLLELEQLKGTLVVKAEVYMELYAHGQRVRQAIQSVPKRTIDDIRAASNRTEAAKILSDALDDALRVLADADHLKI
jgi:hypothetical protein